MDIFFILTTDVDVDIEKQISDLKADLAPIKADLAGATAGSTANALVRRDANKDFQGSKIRADSLESAGTTLSIASANNTSTVNIGSGTAVQTINVGNNGAGATVINLGGAGDTVNISGVLNNITTTNTQIMDKLLVLNSGRTASTAGSAGIFFEEAGVSSNSYVRVSSDRGRMELKAPNGPVVSLNQSLLKADDVTFWRIAGASLQAYTWTTPDSQGLTMGWNRPGGSASGRTTFANHQGLGAGGFEWINYNLDGPYPSASAQMTLDRSGNLAVTGNMSSPVAPTTANHLCNKTYVAGKVPQGVASTDIVTFGGLKLPTVGGTAATLSHYEEYNVDMSWTDTTGTTPVSIVRVGRMVTLTSRRLINFSAGSTKLTGGIQGLTPIPSRFCPTDNLQTIRQLICLTRTDMQFATCDIEPQSGTSVWSVRIRPYPGAFLSTDTGSVERFSVSWTI